MTTGQSLGLLRAGALIPVAEPAADEEPSDTVSARRYAHAALGDRSVVRLVADAIAAAEDLALEFLGLRLDEASAPLARGRRQALGFPGWALVNDPANGSYALAVVKDLERLSRLARAKPGNAKEGFEWLGQQLERSVPHFLPTFYEQAGRAFVESGNVAQAAGMFGRAREAERVYGLSVDEERRRLVFLEFALAGALTVKALEDYAEQLAEVHPPAEAYAVFRELCLQRTQGGVPPWTGMAARLQHLARAAQLEPAREAERTLLVLLEAPATRLAGAGFWKAYRAPLVNLAKQQPRVRALLLHLFPEPQSGADGFEDWWLEFLEACGALADLEDPAAWLARTVASAQRGWRPHKLNRLVALLPRLAPRLRELGVPVDLVGRRAWRVDLGLIDAALELEIPVAPPSRSTTLTLEPPAYGRNLEYIVSHPDWRPLMHNALAVFGANQRGGFDRLPSESGVQRLLVDWLDGRADVLEQGGLPLAASVLDHIERVVPQRALALNPRARARIAAADLGATLARTLRGGLMDEFGWPALEAAWPKLAPPKGGRVQVGYAWPNLILSDGARAVVVGPSEVLLEHDLRPPPQPVRPIPNDMQFAGGQLLVIWQRQNGTCAYWSARPDVVFDLRQAPYTAWQLSLEASWALADGSRTAGGRALHPGDTSVAETAHMLSDGTTFWQLIFESHTSFWNQMEQPRGRLREYDPTTGRPGALSLPAFLRDFVRDDDEALRLDRSWLLPLAPGLEATPLGTAGGMVGWRVRATGASFEGQGIDGRGFSGSLAPHAHAGSRQFRDQLVAAGLVSLPGDAARPRPLSLTGQYVSWWSADGAYELFESHVGAEAPALARGTPLVLSPLYWHNLRPRDPAGSLALRGVSDAVARQLLESALREVGDAAPATDELIRKLLPEVRDGRLLAGIGGVVREAARLARLRPPLAQAVEPLTATDGAPALTDLELRAALRGLLGPTIGWRGDSSSTTVAQLQAVAGVIGGGPIPKSITAAALPWAELVGRMGAVAFRAVAGPTPAAERTTLLTLLDVWAETPFASPPPPKPTSGGLRQVLGRLIGQRPGPTGRHIRVAQVRDNSTARRSSDEGMQLLRNGDHVWLIGELNWSFASDYRRWLLEVSADGSFSVPREYSLEHERRVSETWDETGRLRAVAAQVRARGPLPWRPEWVDLLTVSTGLARAEAALLLAGLPGVESSEQNFLDKEMREVLGLKVAEAAAARETFRRLASGTRLDLLAAAMPADPERVWDSAELVERMAAAWIERFGRRASVPDQLIVQVRAALKTPVEAASLLAACADPTGDPRLNRDGAWALEASNLVTRNDSVGQPVFDGGLLLSLALALPWLFVMLPVGDPLRTNLPTVLERVRRRLDNPDLLADFGWLNLETEGRGVLELLPPAFVAPPASASTYVRLLLRPALVTGTEDASLMRLVGGGWAYAPTRFLRSAGATAMAERIARTPVLAGGYESNPLLSAEPVVDDVVAHLDLDRDAAALYLQVLTLAEPTARNLGTWNGWPAARLATAFDTLVERELLTRGTRARAGRDAFLPCAWEDLKAPNLPLERWKLPLYEHAPIAERVLPLRPLHELFATAWQRVRAGAGPAFEPVPPMRGARS